MNNFLNHIDHNNVFSFLNINEQAQILANEARNGTLSQRLTGKELLKRSLECELRSDNHDIIDIDSITNEIWNSRLTTSQKKELASIADNVNKFRNANTIERITRINTPQITKTDFEESFFNGKSFHDEKNLESSILPLGTIYRG
jgi:hypothetical protein